MKDQAALEFAEYGHHNWSLWVGSEVYDVDVDVDVGVGVGVGVGVDDGTSNYHACNPWEQGDPEASWAWDLSLLLT